MQSVISMTTAESSTHTTAAMHFPIHIPIILSTLCLTGMAALLDFYELPDFKGTIHSIEAKDLEPRACGTPSPSPNQHNNPLTALPPQPTSQKAPKSPPSTLPKPPKPPVVSSTGKPHSPA